MPESALPETFRTARETPDDKSTRRREVVGHSAERTRRVVAEDYLRAVTTGARAPWFDAPRAPPGDLSVNIRPNGRHGLAEALTVTTFRACMRRTLIRSGSLMLTLICLAVPGLARADEPNHPPEC